MDHRRVDHDVEEADEQPGGEQRRDGRLQQNRGDENGQHVGDDVFGPGHCVGHYRRHDGRKLVVEAVGPAQFPRVHRHVCQVVSRRLDQQHANALQHHLRPVVVAPREIGRPERIERVLPRVALKRTALVDVKRDDLVPYVEGEHCWCYQVVVEEVFPDGRGVEPGVLSHQFHRVRQRGKFENQRQHEGVVGDLVYLLVDANQHFVLSRRIQASSHPALQLGSVESSRHFPID
mmetsp:Transcript_24439/g.61428  ORF Transcript_24439/g.61428 Transcript_24439/m.61428 type:complete len:233 (-) Transcript_24439:687-1385(-)